MTAADDAVPSWSPEPLHLYLQRCRDAIPGLTNVKIAEACGYPWSNVISMIFTGKQPLPLDKVGAVADALQLGRASLLRRALLEYRPEILAIIDEELGTGSSLTSNEARVLRHIRATLGTDDLPLDEDAAFRDGFTALLLQARERHRGAPG